MNFMAGNLTGQVRNIADVTKAVAAGDLSKKITVDVKGEILELKNTVNTMVDQLRSFAAEVTRVAREVGTEGKLGGQAKVEGVSGTWKDLTDTVNCMAGNLTGQVRGIAKVVTAVANGDLKRKLTVEAKGEIAELADTINEHDRHAGDVRRSGDHGGPRSGRRRAAGRPGQGARRRRHWKALTENVNQLAANLTTQVRAIAEVATAVTKGDLTRSITVEAQGEVAALKDTINEMIRNLSDTTLKNTEQDWLKTNLAKFSRMLQGQRDLTNVGRMVLSELCPVVDGPARRVLRASMRGDDAATDAAGQLRLAKARQRSASESAWARGWSGSAPSEKQKILLDDLPAGLHPHLVRAGRRAAAKRAGAAADLRRPGHGRAGTGLVRRLQPDAPGVPRTTHRVDRHRAQHDRSQHADGRAAQAVAVAGPAAANPAGRVAADQRGTARKGPPAGPAEPGSRTQEHRSRTGPAGAGREGQAARADLASTSPSSWRTCRHELRTPLNSLLILSDQLSQEPERQPDAASRPSSPRRFTRPATTC